MLLGSCREGAETASRAGSEKGVISGHLGDDRQVGISRHDEQPADHGGLSTRSGGRLWLLCLGVFPHTDTHTQKDTRTERHTPLGDFPRANVSVKPIPRFGEI